ncbi:MAG: RES family NAD+ phosphorylase [Dehalococcoidia bacterium]
MARPTGWDASAAIAGLGPGRWKGRAWRFHRRRYEALDSSGSLLVSGRYNRGSDQFSTHQTWPALYLALRPETALGEVVRHVTVELLGKLNDFRLSELEVELEAVLDCHDETALGLAAGVLSRDYDFEPTQALAAAAIDRDAEGILVPSATGLGDNLIVFPTRVQASSRLAVLDSRDPRLNAPR